jgi:hypothetical protein
MAAPLIPVPPNRSLFLHVRSLNWLDSQSYNTVYLHVLRFESLLFCNSTHWPLSRPDFLTSESDMSLVLRPPVYPRPYRRAEHGSVCRWISQGPFKSSPASGAQLQKLDAYFLT